MLFWGIVLRFIWRILNARGEVTDSNWSDEKTSQGMRIYTEYRVCVILGFLPSDSCGEINQRRLLEYLVHDHHDEIVGTAYAKAG